MAGNMVTFPSNGHECSGFLAVSHAPGPAVIVLQEFWGLNDDIKDIAERFAGEGFVALAPDMYHGQVATEPDEARKLAMELQLDRAAQDLKGAVSSARPRIRFTEQSRRRGLLYGWQPVALPGFHRTHGGGRDLLRSAALPPSSSRSIYSPRSRRTSQGRTRTRRNAGRRWLKT